MAIAVSDAGILTPLAKLIGMALGWLMEDGLLEVLRFFSDLWQIFHAESWIAVWLTLVALMILAVGIRELTK